MTAALVSLLPTVAYAEGATCMGESCEGTYAAVTTTGEASSSQGAAVSGTGSADGSLAEVEGESGVATVGVPVVGGRAGLDNTGDADVPLDPVSISYVQPPEAVAAKKALILKMIPEVTYQLAAAVGGLDPHLADAACPDGRCFAVQHTLSQWLTPQIRDYYCGPASTQMLLAQLGILANQDSLLTELKTEENGGKTWYGDIARVLNELQATYNMTKAKFTSMVMPDTWDPAAYLAIVLASVFAFEDPTPHSVVNNLTSTPLAYWRDTVNVALHFNVSHGFSFGGGGYIDVAEEYDITRFPTKRTHNPYGYHRVPLEEIYRAIQTNKRVVVW